LVEIREGRLNPMFDFRWTASYKNEKNVSRVRKKTFYLKLIIRLLDGSKGASRRNLQTRPKILKENQTNQSEKIFPKKKYVSTQGRTGSPNFGGIFFRGAPKKGCQNENADKKKKKKKKVIK
jgi:hypothetical protein